MPSSCFHPVHQTYTRRELSLHNITKEASERGATDIGFFLWSLLVDWQTFTPADKDLHEWDHSRPALC